MVVLVLHKLDNMLQIPLWLSLLTTALAILAATIGTVTAIMIFYAKRKK